MLTMSIKKYSPFINILFITILFVGLGMSSTIVPFLAAGHDRVFAGFHGYSADYVGYVSYIKEGMYGHLAMNFRSYPPTQPATPIHWEYILAGVLFAPFNIEAPIIYHLLRAIFGSLFIALAYSVFQKVFAKRHLALIATIAAFTISCVGWFSFSSGTVQIKIFNYFPFFISTPQRATDRPHYLLGSILFLCAFQILLKRTLNIRSIALLGLLAFLTIMVHVSSGVVLALLSGVLIVISFLPNNSKEHASTDRIYGFTILASSLIASGISYYYIQQYSAVSDIFLDKFTYSAGINIQSIWRQIISFGPLLWLGLIGLIVQALQKNPKTFHSNILMLSWGVIHLLLFFFLYPIFRVDQVRFVQSLYYIPLAYGTIWLIAHLALRFNTYLFHLGIFLLLAFAFPTYLAQLDHDLHDMTNYKTFAPFGFPTKNQYAAYKFLDTHTPIESTVLSEYEAANMILLYSHNRVLGNDQGWTASGGSHMKEEVFRFLTGSLSHNEALLYLQNNHVMYIYEGFREKAFGNIAHYSFLEEVYKNTEVTIYRVK